MNSTRFSRQWVAAVESIEKCSNPKQFLADLPDLLTAKKYATRVAVEFDSGGDAVRHVWRAIGQRLTYFMFNPKFGSVPKLKLHKNVVKWLEDTYSTLQKESTPFIFKENDTYFVASMDNMMVISGGESEYQTGPYMRIEVVRRMKVEVTNNGEA